ncbi:hypothetical protein PR202_gb10287 [Eleusine coracana subsp. coracana]|uniref:Protein FAR1-RELATED SEQUENCE n=1 Tax=Eleusine coracana subsp. coracana TaxID=191504 RepID=A0AAV5EH57_ELECO|nr:hypothetical protein PR202_gb10287 [Eleusine coracana subsp. coracana]
MMEMGSNPGEELTFPGNPDDDDDAEDISPGSKEFAALVEAAAETVEMDAAAAASASAPHGDDRTPRDGMVFKSYEEVLNFYKRYALRTGFGVCVKKSSFTKAGLCRRLVLVCNKWGNGKEDACYQARPTAKTNCQATVVARLWGDGLLHLTDVNLEHNHALNPSAARFLRCYKTLPSGLSKDLVVRAARGESSAYGEIDVPIFDDWGRLKIGEADVAAINSFFADMQARQPNSFYVMDFYVEGHLRSVLWADSRSRAAYQYFNDAILVDTTCLRSKFNVPLVSFLGVNHHGHLVLLGCGLLSDESTESFLWLFKSWLTCMKGRPPIAIVTDECVAIKAAVREVFPKTRHRINDWHVVQSISEKLGESAEYEAFKTQVQTVIYDSLKNDEFEARWKNLVDRFGLQDNEWIIFLFENRHLWAPAFLKDAFWAGLCTGNLRGNPNAFFEDSISPETTLVEFLGSYMVHLQNKYKMEQDYDFESLNNSRCLRLVEMGMASDEKYQLAARLLLDIQKTLLDDNLCRELEQKLTPSERAIANGDNHAHPGPSEGGPAKKRRGRPPKKGKEISLDSMESLLVSDVSQKGTFHSSSTASNLGTHMRTHGVVDLMEEVNANELSFDSRYGVQSGHPHHFGNQMHAGNTLQFGQPSSAAEQSRVQWMYPNIFPEAE